jgi:hypothetical protein
MSGANKGLVVVIFGCLFVIDCASAQPEDSLDGGVNPETGADGGGDASGGEGGACPINSGYPCACELTRLTCDDGADCFPSPGSDRALCSKACSGAGDTESCVLTDFGVQAAGGGACAAVTRDGGVEGDHCLAICLLDGRSGPCPPGLECVTRNNRGTCR